MDWSRNDMLEAVATFLLGYMEIGGSVYFGCAIGAVLGRIGIDMLGAQNPINPMSDMSYIIKEGLFALVASGVVWWVASAALDPGMAVAVAAAAGAIGAANAHRM